MSDYLENLNPANLVNVVKQLARDVAELKGKTVNVDSLDELTNDLGTMMAGEFRSGNGVEPGEGFTGGRFGYPGFEYGGKSWFLVGAKNDTMMVGLDLESGAIYGAGGELLIDESGLTIEGLRSGIEIKGKNGAYTRKLLLETLLAKNSLIPAGALTYVDDDGAELLTNGDFELGDLSSWTPDDAAEWSIDNEKPFEGEYYAKCELGVIDSGTLTSDQYAVTEKVPYHITGRVAADNDYGDPRVYADWYDAASGGNIILSEAVKVTPFEEIKGFSWTRYSGYFVAPEGAMGLKLRLYAAGFTGAVNIYYDSISVKPCVIMRRLILANELEFFDGENYRRLLCGKKTLFTPPAPTVALVTTGTGNVNNGAHLYKVTFVDAEGETSASVASNSVTVDGTHKQVTVAIPLGPIGTVSRRIYRTEAGGSVYKALASVANNTTLSYTDNIADASLTTAAPVLNTTGGLPLYPTTATISGGCFLRNGTDVLNVTYNGGAYGNTYFLGAGGVNLDNYVTGALLKKGTYYLKLYHYKASNRGRVDIYIDGVLVASGIDNYAASPVAGADGVSGIVVDADGWHEINIKVNGKNASSSAYLFSFTSMELTRTGD